MWISSKYLEMKHTAERSYTMRRNQHVSPHPKGGYQVKAAGASRATKRFETQKEAIAEGRRIAKKQKTELLIHNKEGQVREKDSYGHDPFPPKG